MNCALMCDKVLHMKRTMTRTNFYFPAQMIARVRQASAKLGIPMSEVIRRAIEAHLREMGL